MKPELYKIKLTKVAVDLLEAGSNGGYFLIRDCSFQNLYERIVVNTYLSRNNTINSITDGHPLFLPGECYTKLNELDEAKRSLKKSTELTKDESPYIALARVYLLEDQVTDAQNAYTAALR